MTAMIDPDRLRDALDETREALAAAARAAGRAAAAELVLAGKYASLEDTEALVAAGVGVVGENRLQDLVARQERARGRLTFDFIGHLQRRKAREVMPRVRLLHSLDSGSLASEIAKRRGGEKEPVRVLVQVNVAEEETKGGIVLGQLRAFVEEVSTHPEIVIGGLMAMPPAQSDAERSRPHFARARAACEELRERWRGRHDLADLSMGTSQDWRVAAEEGASMVRVGRALIERARAA